MKPMTRWQLLTRAGWSKVIMEVPPGMRSRFEDEYERFRRDNPGTGITLGSFCRSCLYAFFELEKAKRPPVAGEDLAEALDRLDPYGNLGHDRECCDCSGCEAWRRARETHPPDDLEDTQQ